ncbi:MAG: hypothetical protein WC956_02845 [bacterium]
MKHFFLFLVLITWVTACGSATEVGNPTADVPRTIAGTIDVGTLPDVSAAASKSEEAVVDASALNVFALATDGTSVDAPVGFDGIFSMVVIVGKTYIFSVRTGTQTIGDFSFEQNDQGQRGDSLTIDEPGDTIQMGDCRYENGFFIPQHEPRRYMGVSGGQGGGGGNGQGG